MEKLGICMNRNAYTFIAKVTLLQSINSFGTLLLRVASSGQDT